MIIRFFLLCILVFFVSCTSNRGNTDRYNAALEDSLFLDKAPVRNLGYQFFLFSLQYYRADTPASVEHIPDSSLIHRRYPSIYSRVLPRMNSTFFDSSVVGVSFEKAQSYCRWRAEESRREVYRKSKSRKDLLVNYSLPGPEDFKNAERLAAGRKDKNNWQYLFEGPPEWTNIPGYVWVKSKEGGRLVQASEVPAHEITFRCKAELRPPILPPIF